MVSRLWLALAAFALLLVGFAIWTWRGWARERGALGAAAAELAAGLPAKLARQGGAWTLRGSGPGGPFTLTLASRYQIRDEIDAGPPFVPELRIERPCAAGASLELHFAGRDFRNELRRMATQASGARVATGDSAFDARFVVSSAGDPGAVGAALTPGLRGELLRLEPGFASQRWAVRIGGGRARLTERIVRHDGSVTAPALADLVCRRLELLDRIAAAAERASGGGAPGPR